MLLHLQLKEFNSCLNKKTNKQIVKPRLKVEQLIINLLDADVSPEDIIVAINCIDDIVVKAVQLLQQSQLLPNLQ